MRAAVLTVSDRCFRGEYRDTSGPAIAKILRTRLDAAVVEQRCLPDEHVQLASCFAEWCRPEFAIDLVVSTGGTGLAPRDVTPEAALSVIERQHAGLMELARLRCLARTPRAFLSRGVAGSAGRTLILTLPGSERGATEKLEALLDVLPHAIQTLRGDVQHDGRPDATIDG
ncbi:MAG: MogA/MoaB family molybdenum cofactor biosynthesis protein [Leptolyngbya sp. PLA3]|nr:MAG: MogA/MoaB family molybdenum cofactor biosynthesis protein [Cyanobacteria bacterium CYA]MCE7969960.1 MogA/MoaB family molybdenum cofactor biosynthesis protein [Leptolyngbya sp. PL-A3]